MNRCCTKSRIKRLKDLKHKLWDHSPKKPTMARCYLIDFSTPVGRGSQPGPGSPVSCWLRIRPKPRNQCSVRSFLASPRTANASAGAKPSGSIQLLGKFLEGHNSGEQVPKSSKGEKGSKSTQPHETIQKSSCVGHLQDMQRGWNTFGCMDAKMQLRQRSNRVCKCRKLSSARSNFGSQVVGQC